MTHRIQLILMRAERPMNALVRAGAAVALLVLGVATSPVCADAPPAAGPAAGATPKSPAPGAAGARLDAVRAWAEVLARRVGADGLVDYRGLARDDRATLDAYLARVAEAKPPAARAEALAFYADAYNALVIRSVIRAGFPRSVLDERGFFDETTHVVGGRTLTLDALEKEVIRPLGNPLHHFILVCGAVGCPALEPRTLVGSDVEARAEAAARRYLSTAHGARRAAPAIQLSRIFEWYAADFGGPAGVRAWVRPRLPAVLAAELRPDTPLLSLDYNWTLNQR
jgi:hypothetical protein